MRTTSRQIRCFRWVLIILGGLAAGAVTCAAVGAIVGIAYAAIVGMAAGVWVGLLLWIGLPPSTVRADGGAEVAGVALEGLESDELGRVHLCYLHEDGDEHWCTAEEIVGVYLLDGATIRTEQTPSPAHRECAKRLIEPERIVWPNPAGSV